MPDAPQILLLGPLDVRIGARQVPLGGRQPRALFSVLALQPGVCLQMPYIVRELWDGDPPGGATNTVQVYVSRLRRLLTDAEQGHAHEWPLSLRGHQNGYLLDAAPGTTDIQHFEQLIAAGQEAKVRKDAAAASDRWREALTLWRGPALQDLAGPGGQARRAGLEAQRMRTLADRLDADAELGRHEAIIPELEELIREHPFDERLVGQLMGALYGVGRQAYALAVYADAVARLAEELGVDPGPELRQIQGAVLRQEPSLTTRPSIRIPHRPSQQASAGRPVPAIAPPRTELIGRRGELASVRSLLRSAQVRLLTLVGTGGAGKTRLALEVAATLAHETGIAIPVVALETATDPEDLLPRICHALGAAPSWPAHPLLDVIATSLGDSPRVVVLDNLEALVHAGAGPRLAQLLDAVPGLTILATSRAPLRLRGEHLLALPPLSLPQPQHEGDPAHVLGSESGQLFMNRAQAVMPGFAVTEENCAAVAQVCRMLDGLPLAVELAAARIRLLPPREMLRRVGARLGLLTGGASDLPERQRSMRAVLESSVQLLSEDETMLFARLSVFNGGWTLPDAEAVFGQNVLDGLDRLVDRSLVVADGSGRFALLGVVREYAAVLLSEQDDAVAAAAQRAHAEHFAARAAELAQDVARHPDSTTSSWPGQEAANLDVALEYARRSDDGQLLARLMTGLLDHWFYSGRIHQADRWVAMADAARLAPRERAHLLLSAGNLALVAGDLDRAGPMLGEAHVAAVTAGDPELTSRTLAARSVVSRHRGQPIEALELVDQALDAAARHGPGGSWALTVRLGNERGELLDETGHPELAEPLFESFGDWSRSEQSASNEAVAVVNLALVAADRGDQSQARELLQAALVAVGRSGSAPLHGDVLYTAGLVHLQLGDPFAAGRCVRQAAPLMFAAGQLLTLPDTIALLAVCALQTGHSRTAARLFGVSDAWRAPRGLAITGRRAQHLISRAASQLGAAIPDANELRREKEYGARAPYGALPQVAQAIGWERVWIADLRTDSISIRVT